MIPRRFFQRDPLTCARELIGCGLVWGECRGIIVETEAYSVVNDEASHTFVRPSARAFVAKHPPGTAYVYFNYGMHWLLNVLVKGGAEDGFVLLRALEPRRGMDLMEQRRGQTVRTALCSGPGKLAQALGVTGADHGRDLCSDPATAFRARREVAQVESDLRIGISKAAHLPWRFLLQGSAFVSVRPGRSAKPPIRNGAALA
jgi:DNA-3-methyladenine glycosylase